MARPLPLPGEGESAAVQEQGLAQEKVQYGKKVSTPCIDGTTLLRFRCKNENWTFAALNTVILKKWWFLIKNQPILCNFLIILLWEFFKICMPRRVDINHKTNSQWAYDKNTHFSSDFDNKIVFTEFDLPLDYTIFSKILFF